MFCFFLLTENLKKMTLAPKGKCIYTVGNIFININFFKDISKIEIQVKRLQMVPLGYVIIHITFKAKHN